MAIRFRNLIPSLPFRLPRERRLAVALHHHQTGKAYISATSKESAERATATDTEAVKINRDAVAIAAVPVAIVDRVDPNDNDDLERRRINRGKRKHGIVYKIYSILRFIKKIYHYYFPVLTAEELEEKQEREQRQREYAAYRADAFAAFRTIRNKLTQLGFCHVYQKGNGKRNIIDRITFGKLSASSDGRLLYGRVEHWPDGVKGTDLVNKITLDELTASVGRPVSGKLWLDGCIYTVDRAGVLGLPDNILFRELLHKIPADSMPLTFIVGVAQNGKVIRRSLETFPHLLGAGETGGGKTNCMHSMILTLIARNKPEDCQLLMIDLKFGGVALTRYEGIPHLIRSMPDCPSGIATDLKSSKAVLQFALEEADRRGKLFVEDPRHVQKIEEWNKLHRSKRLPRIVIFIDEIALLMDISDMGAEEAAIVKEIRRLIKTILRLARSSGVHVCGFTQTLDKSVMNVAFKTNVAARICFSVADAPSSILAIGNGDAVNLSPAGRAVFKRGTDRVLVQTPLVVESDMTKIIKNAMANKLSVDIKGQTVTADEIIKWAIEENDFSLKWEQVVNKYQEVMSQAKINALLKSMDNQTFQIGEFSYKVKPGNPHVPRKVVKL